MSLIIIGGKKWSNNFSIEKFHVICYIHLELSEILRTFETDVKNRISKKNSKSKKRFRQLKTYI